MAKPAVLKKMTAEEAISDRISRLAGALGSAMRARMGNEMVPVMREIDTLLDQACILERLVFTRKVLNTRAAPRALIERLLRDNYLVAKAMIQAGYGLDDERLIELMIETGGTFPLEVATRAGLSERITDFLMDMGDAEITYRLAANKRATLSRKTLTSLINRAASDHRLDRALTHRLGPSNETLADPADLAAHHLDAASGSSRLHGKDDGEAPVPIKGRTKVVSYN